MSGLGTLLTRKAMSHVGAQGQRPVLHCYADNDYHRLGYRIRSEMIISVPRRA